MFHNQCEWGPKVFSLNGQDCRLMEKWRNARPEGTRQKVNNTMNFPNLSITHKVSLDFSQVYHIIPVTDDEDWFNTCISLFSYNFRTLGKPIRFINLILFV